MAYLEANAQKVRMGGKYPPAEPGALGIGPLEAAVGVADATPFIGPIPLARGDSFFLGAVSKK